MLHRCRRSRSGISSRGGCSTWSCACVREVRRCSTSGPASPLRGRASRALPVARVTLHEVPAMRPEPRVHVEGEGRATPSAIRPRASAMHSPAPRHCTDSAAGCASACAPGLAPSPRAGEARAGARGGEAGAAECRVRCLTALVPLEQRKPEQRSSGRRRAPGTTCSWRLGGRSQRRTGASARCAWP